MNGIINDIGDYFKNKDGRYSDYAPICSRIKTIIRQDQIEGGMAMIYNPSITQRLNGLKESTDVTTNGESVNKPIIIDFSGNSNKTDPETDRGS